MISSEALTDSARLRAHLTALRDELPIVVGVGPGMRRAARTPCALPGGRPRVGLPIVLTLVPLPEFEKVVRLTRVVTACRHSDSRPEDCGRDCGRDRSRYPTDLHDVSLP